MDASVCAHNWAILPYTEVTLILLLEVSKSKQVFSIFIATAAMPRV